MSNVHSLLGVGQSITAAIEFNVKVTEKLEIPSYATSLRHYSISLKTP